MPRVVRYNLKTERCGGDVNKPGTCIFCKGLGPFKRVEHPIPESLGNDDLTLPAGFVCDSCNQYFGTKLEHETLSYPPFSVERTIAAIRTKKGKLPKHEDKLLTLCSTGFWDRAILVPRSYHSCPLVQRSDGSGLLLVNQAPRSDEIIARFLLKVGLELLVLSSFDVRDSQFEVARLYARFGQCQRQWEVAYGLYPERGHLAISKREDEIGPLETRQIYQYEMGQMSDGRIVFCFVFITHVFAVSLTHDRLGPYLGEFNRMNKFELRSNLVA